MKTSRIVGAIVLLIAIGLFGFLFLLDRSADLDRDIEDVDIIGIVATSTPALAVSSEIVEQGGALGFAVAGTDDEPQVTWGNKKIPVFKIKTGYVGAVGVALSDVPREENLQVKLVSGETLERRIQITKKDYAVTVLSVPKKAADQGVTTASLTKNIVADDNQKIVNATAFSNTESYIAEDFVSPTREWVGVGGFGIVRKSEESSIRHLGTDLKAEVGDDIFATNTGRVVLAEYLNNYGNTIIIDHGQGLSSLYLHLSNMNVAVGDVPKRGQKIGGAGSTGLYSFEPHLHFSIRLRGASLDPKAFMDAINSVL
jgi:murein DD-endopeptidase MepM/ murein hydrolase activator NlpD